MRRRNRIRVLRVELDRLLLVLLHQFLLLVCLWISVVHLRDWLLISCGPGSGYVVAVTQEFRISVRIVRGKVPRRSRLLWCLDKCWSWVYADCLLRTSS